jgi:hypothetical protein
MTIQSQNQMSTSFANFFNHSNTAKYKSVTPQILTLGMMRLPPGTNKVQISGCFKYTP